MQVIATLNPSHQWDMRGLRGFFDYWIDEEERGTPPSPTPSPLSTHEHIHARTHAPQHARARALTHAVCTLLRMHERRACR